MAETLLRMEDVSKDFLIRKSLFPGKSVTLKAVRQVNLSLRTGETLGIVGESGCGKSTLGRLVMRLLDPSSGRILFQGQDLAGLKGEQLRRARSAFQMIFQDPYSCLNIRWPCRLC